MGLWEVTLSAWTRRQFARGPRHSRGTLRIPFVLSALTHLLLLWVQPPVTEKREEVRVMELALVQRGDGPGKEPAEAAVEQSTPPPPRPRSSTPVPPAPTADRPLEPTPTPQPQMPTSFGEWSRNQRAAVPLLANQRNFSGGSRGSDVAGSKGKKRCVPFHQRRVDVVYLLFDSSGSMSQARHSQALGCAHQYAKAAMEHGAWVIVGNFAAYTDFYPPTRNMTDVEIALRGASDARATVLPTTRLTQLFDHNPHAVADMVIVSDGYILNYGELLPSYRYFLEINKENRGYMYTVGSPGHPAVTQALQEIGFDVFIYRLL